MFTDWLSALVQPRAITGLCVFIGLAIFWAVCKWDERKVSAKQTRRLFDGNRNENG